MVAWLCDIGCMMPFKMHHLFLAYVPNTVVTGVHGLVMIDCAMWPQGIFTVRYHMVNSACLEQRTPFTMGSKQLVVWRGAQSLTPTLKFLSATAGSLSQQRYGPVPRLVQGWQGPVLFDINGLSK